MLSKNQLLYILNIRKSSLKLLLELDFLAMIIIKIITFI